ncbi:hypothetical protein [Arthrobacter polaris]|nr:hypothetical protein [Arthrobacter polaris]UIK88424.1 hypothetical protein J0916_13755 [Arthrobacter polaris]
MATSILASALTAAKFVSLLPNLWTGQARRRAPASVPGRAVVLVCWL